MIIVCVPIVSIFLVSRAKAILGRCVKVCEGPVETFSQFMLLFSLTDSSLYGAEDTGFSQIMYVGM